MDDEFLFEERVHRRFDGGQIIRISQHVLPETGGYLFVA